MKKKIKDSVAKRFRVTKTGKVMFGHQYNSHLKAHKSGRRKRRLNVMGSLDPVFAKKIKKMLGVL